MPVLRLPRVLLLIPHLGGGGAERVTALLAQGLPKEKYELHLGLVTQAATQFTLPGVQVHAMGARRVRGGALHLLRLVRRLRPDLILSGMAHLNFLVLLLRPLFPRRTLVIVRQNSTASATLEFGGLPAYTRTFYRLLYRRADRVVCQSEAMARDLAVHLGVPRVRLAVLPNPVDVDAIRTRVTRLRAEQAHTISGASGPHLLAVGRLSPEKGFDLLLSTLAQVRAKFPEADLVIAGAGPEEAALKSVCRAAGLEAAVRFAGYIEDLSEYFACASVFVLSSRHEGMPNALLEAAAAGLPIVALPSSQGVADLLHAQPGVWLARELSSSALAASLLEALAALRPGERFAHEWVEPFRLECAIAAYESLIDSLLHSLPHSLPDSFKDEAQP
jgi:glycosyltransferase involved in cell wall biosynthesis